MTLRGNIFLIVLMALLASRFSYSQNKTIKTTPPAKEDFNHAFLSMELPNEEANDYLKRIQEESILKMSPYVNRINTPTFNEDANKLMACIQGFSLSDTQKLTSTIKDCQLHISNMTKSNWDQLKESGIQEPEKFHDDLKIQLENVSKEIEKFNRSDEIIIVSNFLTFDEIDENELGNLQGIDPNIVSLSQNVQAIIVDYYRSPDVKSLLEDQELQGKSVGKEELIEFSQLLSLIKNKKSNCWTNGQLTKLDNTSDISNVDGFDKGKINQILLGVQNTKDLNAIDGYKFIDGEDTYYLYHGKKAQLSEDSWVMAKVDPQGKMTFRYYKFNKQQEEDIDLSKTYDLSIAQSQTSQTTIPTKNNGRLFFQAQGGMIISRVHTKAPLIGQANLPSGRLVIGEVKMTYVNPTVMVQNRMSIDSQSISLTTQARPTKNTKWSVGAGIHYAPMSNKWDISTNVRVMNFMLGYTDDLKGKQLLSMRYILRQNYVELAADFKGNPEMSIGRQFKNGQGGVAASTNFKNIHEIKLVLFLDRPRR